MKYLTLIALALAATTAQADFWDNCTAYGGTIITANSYSNDKGGLCNDPNDTSKTNNCNGKRFCRSGNKMNWWSGFTWCEAIGGRLVSFASICPGVQTAPNNVTGACPNIKGISSDWVLTAMGWKTHQVLYVNLSSGGITYSTSNTTRANTHNAVCEE